MINIYIHNEEKKELGFAFYLFGLDQYKIDYDLYDSSFKMNEYLQSSKGDILGINIERFLNFCRERIINSTFLISEAIDKINKATQWRISHKHEYEKFLNLVVRGKHMFKDLVNAFDDGEDKVRAIMMYEIMIQFVEKELDVSK